MEIEMFLEEMRIELKTSSPTESTLDVSPGGRLFQTVAEEWPKARLEGKGIKVNVDLYSTSL